MTCFFRSRPGPCLPALTRTRKPSSTHGENAQEIVEERLSEIGSSGTNAGRPDMAKGSLVAGARIRVRDAEWVVGHVEKNSVSGNVIHATGLAGIVRDRAAIFVESVEKLRGHGIEVVDPSNVRLVPDSSGGYEDTL